MWRSAAAPVSRCLGVMGGCCRQFSSTSIGSREFFSAFDNYFFDCDGVLWHGDRVLPGVREMLSELKSKGKKCYYLTNAATKSRQNLADKFQTLGIDVHRDECYTSAYTAGYTLSNPHFLTAPLTPPPTLHGLHGPTHAPTHARSHLHARARSFVLEEHRVQRDAEEGLRGGDAVARGRARGSRDPVLRGVPGDRVYSPRPEGR